MVYQNCKRIVSVVLLGVLAIGMSIGCFADENKIYYGFTMKGSEAFNFSSSRLRSTINQSIPWYAQLASSSEGAGTQAVFAVFKGSTEASHEHTLKQGDPGQTFGSNAFFGAYSDFIVSVGNTNVKLGIRNNNYTTSTYQVSGYWDEEWD